MLVNGNDMFSKISSFSNLNFQGMFRDYLMKNASFGMPTNHRKFMIQLAVLVTK